MRNRARIVWVATYLTMLFVMFPNSRYFFLDPRFLMFRWGFLFSLMMFYFILPGRRSYHAFSDTFALLFFAMIFYSGSYSIFPQMTYSRGIATVLFYVTIFVGFWKVGGRVETFRAASRAFIFAYITVFVITRFIQAPSQMGEFDRGRYTGFFGNPNTLAVITAILIPIAFSLYYESKKKMDLIIMIGMVVMLFMTKTRSALSGLVVFMAVFYHFQSQRNRLLVWTLAIFTAISLIFPEIIIGILEKIPFARMKDIEKLGGRTEVWKWAVEIIASHPIRGHGYGTEDYLLKHYNVFFRHHAGLYLHNSYYGMAAMLGYPGLVLFFSPLFLLLIRSAFRMKAMIQNTNSFLPLGFFGAVIMGLWVGIAESYLYAIGSIPAFPFWVQVMFLYHIQMKMGKRKAIVSPSPHP